MSSELQDELQEKSLGVPNALMLPPQDEWTFGQPAEPGDYEWWSAEHSIRPWEATVLIGYDGNVRGFGRDVWYRKIPASSVLSFRGLQMQDPFRGCWCSTFITITDGVIGYSTNGFIPSFLKPWLGNPFVELVHHRLMSGDGSRLIRIY